MQPTRRTVVLGMGGIAIGTIGAVLSTPSAKAVEATGLDIQGVTNYGEPSKVALNTATAVAWETNRPLDTVTLTTAVGNGYDNLTDVDTTELDDVGQTGDRTVEVSANVLKSSAFATSEFELLPGQSQTGVDIYVEQTVALAADGGTIASDSIRDMATVTVKPEQTELRVSGEGELVVA